MEILRFDRAGKPLPFAATGTNALFVDPAMQVNFWHDVYHGVEVDRHGNIYYVAKADVDAKARPVSAYNAVRRQVNVYDADGKLQTRGLLHLDAVRGIQVDDEGNLYVLHRPAERPWDFYLALSKFPPTGGEPLWSRRWDGYIGQAQVIFAPCHCITSRQHQTLDGKGYLYAAGKHSVQVIDCADGKAGGGIRKLWQHGLPGQGKQVPAPRASFRNDLRTFRLEGPAVRRRRAESAHRQVPHRLRGSRQALRIDYCGPPAPPAVQVAVAAI